MIFHWNPHLNSINNSHTAVPLGDESKRVSDLVIIVEIKVVSDCQKSMILFQTTIYGVIGLKRDLDDDDLNTKTLGKALEKPPLDQKQGINCQQRMTDIKYSKMRETKDGIVYNTRSISFGKSRDLMQKKQDDKNEKSSKGCDRKQQTQVQPLRSLQIKKLNSKQILTSEIGKNKDNYNTMKAPNQRSSSRKRGNIDNCVSSTEALQFPREINSQGLEVNEDSVVPDSGNQQVLKQVPSEDVMTTQSIALHTVITGQSSQNSLQEVQCVDPSLDRVATTVKLAASDLSGRLFQSYGELNENAQQLRANENHEDLVNKSTDNNVMVYRPLLQMSSKKREDSFDFKDQSCVFNNDHNFIDQVVTDSLMQKIEDASDCSFESDKLIKKHSLNQTYSAQKSSIQLHCREMAPLDRSTSQSKIMQNTFQRYPINSQNAFRGNYLFNNCGFVSENRMRSCIRPSIEGDYQKPLIQNTSFQESDIKYQTPNTQHKHLTFANVNSKSEKRQESPPKKTLFQNLSIIQKLTFSGTTNVTMGSSLMDPSPAQNNNVFTQPSFQLSASYEQALLNNKRCIKAKSKKQKKKLNQTLDPQIQNLNMVNEQQMLKTQIYEIKPFNSLVQFNKQLVQQRNQCSLLGKAKSMDNPLEDGFSAERQESSADFAITGEFVQNTVYYKAESKDKSKTNTQTLEYPNLNSVEAYHYQTQDYQKPHVHQHFDNNGVQIEKKFRCSCKNNKCAQGYCDCLKNNEACSPDLCGCTTCENNVDNAFLRMETMQKRTKQPEREGCNCKKSQCLKKYCECRQAGFGCSDKCRCYDCLNKVK